MGLLNNQKVRRPDAGPGTANPDVLFTPHLCLHENTIILADLGQWGWERQHSVSAEGSTVFAVFRKEKNSIMPRK